MKHRALVVLLSLLAACGGNSGGSEDALLSDAIVLADTGAMDNLILPDWNLTYPDSGEADVVEDSAADWVHQVDNGQPVDWSAPDETVVALPDQDDDGIPDVGDPFPSDPNMPGIVAEFTVYAHTESELYLMDVKTYQLIKVGAFAWPFQGDSHQMTDIAVDSWGVMYGLSFYDLYVIHPDSAKVVYLGSLPDSFNGLTIVPAGLIDQDKDVMVGISQSGGWYRLTLQSGQVSSSYLGGYGGNYGSSGDAYSILGVGTYASVNKGDFGDDYLVRLDPVTGAVQEEVGPISGYGSVWGLAGWTGRAFAFDALGDVLVIDTADASVVYHKETDHAWWGAGGRTVVSE